MPTSTNGALKADVQSLLWYGKEHAKKGQDLATTLHTNYRLVRLAIRELIADGLPIISSVHPPYGYYIGDNPQEITEHLGELRHRALEVFIPAQDLKLASREILQPHQVALF